MDRREILRTLREEQVRFLRLRFTDILGADKAVEVPASQFERALDGGIVFDGSAIEGFVRVEESDMLLCPDLDTFVVYPWGGEREGERVARLICDVYEDPQTPHAGCPRQLLKRVLAQYEKKGYAVRVGAEMEFFLFNRDAVGAPTGRTLDTAAYFDYSPGDRGEECRRLIVGRLEQMGLAVEAAHHEDAPGQHEIDFSPIEALRAADFITGFRNVARRIAESQGLHATFMPKPLFGRNGSGMHLHQVVRKAGRNAFADPKSPGGLSGEARGFIAGQLAHAKGMALVTNPLVNSYKRLVPGHEAPVNVAWSEKNRSPLIRVAVKKGLETRVENRLPDSACNPYLAIAVLLAAGLEGMEQKMDPGEPINRNINKMSHREKRRLKIDDLPATLGEALDHFQKDHRFTRATLGEPISLALLSAKEREWREHCRAVHPWELERYLAST